MSVFILKLRSTTEVQEYQEEESCAGTEDTQRSIAGRRRGTSTFHRQIFKNDRLVESHRRLISETSIFEMSPRDTK